MSDALQQAIVAVKTGDHERARRLLTEILQVDPGHELAWVWLSRVAATEERRRECLHQAMTINPRSQEARQALLEWVSTASHALPPPTTIQGVSPEIPPAVPTVPPVPTAPAVSTAAPAASNLKEFLQKLNENHLILKEREAKFATAAPLDLLNQIDDYQHAIAMTKAAIEQDVPLAELQVEFSSLNLQISTVVFVGEEQPRKPFTGANPYRGLRKFTEDDAKFFFGRNAAIQNLLQTVQYLYEEPTSQQLPDLIAVLGPSGSGKSSLVRAGLVPALREGRIEGSHQWPVKVMLPGERPLESLAMAFAGEVGRDIASIRETLAGGESALHDLMVETLTIANKPEEAIFVLVIDQFEELFTLCEDEAERRTFIDQLLYAAQVMRNRSFIILTMRSDFYSKVADYKPLAEAVTRNQMLVSPMTERELREAILLPAEAVGLELEKVLVEKLLDDTRDAPGVLPLLQHALLELFHRRNGNLLMLDAYNEIGGVKGALAFRADAILDSMPMEQRHIVRRILMRLVQPGEGTTNTRRRATFSEVLPQGYPVSEVEMIIQTLIEANLIVTSRHPESDEMVLDVSHEALIKEWPRFQSWLDWDRQGLRIRQQLSQAARDWDKRGRDGDSLYRGVRLLEVEEWVASNPGEINPLEQTFLAASVDARDRARAEEKKRTRNLIIRLTIGLIIVAIGAVFGFIGQYQANQESKRANEAQQTAEAQGRRAEEEAAAAIVARETAVANENLADLRATEAEAARIKAEHQARIATANQLAAQSQMMDDGSGSLPLILAREAVYVTWLTDTEVITQRFVTEEADVALRQAIEEAEELGWRMTLPQNWTRRHTDGVNSAVFSPDGTMIVSAGNDETIWLWDAQTDEALRVFIGHTNWVNSAAFSPDGTMIVSASTDGTARVWDTLTGEELRVFEGHTAGINAAAFSPDGAAIVTASGDHASGTTDNTIRVWDVLTGEELRVFEGHTAEVTSAAFSPDGKMIVSAGHDETVRLWDVQSGEQLQVLAGHTAEVKSVAFSPDGTMIVSASHDGTARVWDAQTGEQLQVLAGHTGRVNSAAFSPDGATIVTGSEGRSEPNRTEKPDDTVRVWNVQTGEELLVLAGHTAGVTSAAFSPDGKMIVSASSDRTVRLWDTQTGEELRTPEGHTASVTSAAFSPDGSTLASTSNDETVRVWDAQTGEELRVLRGHQGSVHAVAFSPDGDTIASASDDQTVRLWNARTGEEQGILRGHGAGVTSVAFSPDGAPGGVTLVSGSHDGEIWQWDAQTGQQLRRLEGHRAGVTAVAFSPDGKMIASASATPPFEGTESPDNTVRVWDAQTGEELLVLKGHTDGVTSVAFSPDSRTIASGSHDRAVRLWDAQTGESLGVLEGHRGGVTSVTFSPNGATLVSVGNGTLREWDVQSGQELCRFESRTVGPNSAVFSPDGNTIVTTNNDHTLQVWNVHVEKRVQKFGGHRATVTSAAFSPDGAALVSADGEGRMQVWDVRSGERLLALESSKSGAADGAGAEGFQQPQGQENLSQINAVTFSPDGTAIASAGNDGAIRLWDAGSGQELQVLESDKDGVTGSTSGQQPQPPESLVQVNAVSYSPDGATLVSASSDGAVQIWDVQTGQQRQVLEGHSTGVNTVAFSPDGGALVSGGSDGTVRVWDAQTGQQSLVLEDKSGVAYVAFSPDGANIIGGSNEGVIRVWDAQTGQQHQVLEGHPAKITSVVYSPDGATIVSTGMDQTMRVWDAQTGQELRVLGGHRFGFYSPDGATIISGANDSVELRMADMEDLLELADSLIQRRLHALTGSERERFGLE